jgi:aryl-alcohol dehydrogenase-like predicted oxidoreductase
MRNKPDTSLYNLPFTTDEFNGMPYQRLGTSGLMVSRVGLGTWKFGYPETGDGARLTQDTAFKVFDRSVELGVTFWDTANRYNAASGNSERVIGDWLNLNPDQRRNIVIATKLYGTMDGLTPNHCRLSRMNILDATYASLERMEIDYVDIMYFHSPDPDTPTEESLNAIEDLVRQDLVRYFAVSNFTVDQLKDYLNVSKTLSNRCQLLAVQNQYDILNKENPPYAGVLGFAKQSGISFVAWSPLARGLLTNRYLNSASVGPGDRLFDEESLENQTFKSNLEKTKQLFHLAENAGISVNQLALAYMLTLDGMGPVIPGVSSVEQLEENARVATIKLDQELCDSIRSVIG